MSSRSPKPAWDVDRMVVDMTERGWTTTRLARAAQVHAKTVARFFADEVQTTTTAAKIAAALGFAVKRYLRRHPRRALRPPRTKEEGIV